MPSGLIEVAARCRRAGGSTSQDSWKLAAVSHWLGDESMRGAGSDGVVVPARHSNSGAHEEVGLRIRHPAVDSGRCRRDESQEARDVNRYNFVPFIRTMFL